MRVDESNHGCYGVPERESWFWILDLCTRDMSGKRFVEWTKLRVALMVLGMARREVRLKRRLQMSYLSCSRCDLHRWHVSRK